MIKTMETASKQYDWLKPFQFKPGESGNKNGRPQGSISIKQRVKQYLEDHPEEADLFVGEMVHKERKFTWQMLEGAPQTKTDLTSKGEKLAITVLSFDEYSNSSQLQAE